MYFKNCHDSCFFDEYLIEKKRLAESSRMKYVKTAEKFIVESQDLEDIEEYNKFLIKYSIKGRSKHYYSILKAFIEYKITDSSKRSTMIENLIKPQIETTRLKERKHLSEKQIISIINKLKYRKHVIIALIQHLTGIRFNDVVKLKRGNIIPEIYNNTPVLKLVVEGKGKKRNVIFIHDELIQKLIMDYVVQNFHHTEYYFIEHRTTSKDNNFLFQKIYKNNYKYFLVDLKSAMYKVGIDKDDFSTHDFRRCYARRVWTRYKDLEVLQDLLNHANPATTMLYLRGSGLKTIDYHRDMQLNKTSQ